MSDKPSAAMSLPVTQALSQITSVERTRKLSILLKHHKILVRLNRNVHNVYMLFVHKVGVLKNPAI